MSEHANLGDRMNRQGRHARSREVKGVSHKPTRLTQTKSTTPLSTNASTTNCHATSCKRYSGTQAGVSTVSYQYTQKQLSMKNKGKRMVHFSNCTRLQGQAHLECGVFLHCMWPARLESPVRGRIPRLTDNPEHQPEGFEKFNQTTHGVGGVPCGRPAAVPATTHHILPSIGHAVSFEGGLNTGHGHRIRSC